MVSNPFNDSSFRRIVCVGVGLIAGAGAIAVAATGNAPLAYLLTAVSAAALGTVVLSNDDLGLKSTPQPIERETQHRTRHISSQPVSIN